MTRLVSSSVRVAMAWSLLASTGIPASAQPARVSAAAESEAASEADDKTTTSVSAADDTVNEPPLVEFDAHTPKIRIWPNGGKGIRGGKGGKEGGGAPLTLTFDEVQELDCHGKELPRRRLENFDAREDMVWEQEERQVGGAPAIVTKLSLSLRQDDRFLSRCDWEGAAAAATETESEAAEEMNASDTDGARRLGATNVSNIAIATYVFTSDAVVQYGNDTFDVVKGQFKFNFESEEWPFCGTNHSLRVGLRIDLGSGKPPRVESHDRRVPAGHDERQNTDRRGGDSASTHGGNPGEHQDGGNHGEKQEGGDTADHDQKENKENEERDDGLRRADGNERRRPKDAMAFAGGDGDFAFAMDFPTTVIRDGVPTEIQVEMDERPDRLAVKLVFPYFNESLLYDPLVSVGADNVADATASAIIDSGSSAAPSAAFLFFSAALGVAAAAV